MFQSSRCSPNESNPTSHGRGGNTMQSFKPHITVSLPGQPVTATSRNKNNLPTKPKAANAQEFAFVNSTAPGRNRDPDVRRLVRGHVVRDSSRRKKLQRQQQLYSSEDSESNKSKAGKAGSFDSAGSVSLNPEQVALALSHNHSSEIGHPTQGIDPHPELSPHLYRITALGDAMYPQVSSFKFNPISPAAWFGSALQDEALFHALLYITCTYANLITGSSDNHEAIEHVGKSVTLVKERLEGMIPGGKKPDKEYLENTVRTVSCLAITEGIKGNIEGWRIHMAGLKQLVALNDGLTTLDIIIQLKVHRADLLGAVDFLEEPFFDKENSLPGIPSRHSESQKGPKGEMALLFNTLPISDELHDILAYMHSLSHVVSRILGGTNVCSAQQQVVWQKHADALRYALLHGLGKCESQDQERRTLDEALRIGALLYVQATPPEFPYSAAGPTKLVARLKMLVLSIQMWNEREATLVIWLLLMGGISARNREDKVWFVSQLGKLTARLRLLDWKVVHRRVEKLCWVGLIHDKTCKKLWDEMIEMRTLDDIYSYGTVSEPSI